MRNMKKIFALIMVIMLLTGTGITAFAQEPDEGYTIYTYNQTTCEIEKNELLNDGLVLTPVTEITGGGVLWYIYGVLLYVDGEQVEAYDNGYYYEYMISAEKSYSVEVGRVEGDYTSIILETITSNAGGFAEDMETDGYVMSHEHDYQWIITVDPTEEADGLAENVCKYCPAKSGSQPVSKATAWVKGVVGKIENAPENETVVVNSDIYFCYTDRVMDALKLRYDVTLTTYFTDEEGGIKGFTIPAGQAPDDDEQFYGFTGLGNTYGWLELSHF